MSRLLALLFTAAVQIGAMQCALADPAPATFPGYLRWDLVPQWISWDGAKAAVKTWPPNDGCAAAAAAETLPAGTLIDRFGFETGSFFSPKGESYNGRAVPYACKQMDYRVYKVLAPLPVQSCMAAPWFGEPGGAKQVKTAANAATLVANKTIEAVEYDAVASGKSSPLCGSP